MPWIRESTADPIGIYPAQFTPGKLEHRIGKPGPGSRFAIITTQEARQLARLLLAEADLIEGVKP